MSLLDHPEETMDVSLHVDSVLDVMTNVSLFTVNTFEPINASTHIDDSTDVIYYRVCRHEGCIDKYRRYVQKYFGCHN